MNEELRPYWDALNEETRARMSELPNRVLAFTDYILSEISELINVADYHVNYGCLKNSSGNVMGELYGYAVSGNDEVLHLFYTIYDSQGDGIISLSSADYQTAVNRLQGFYNQAIRGLYYDLREDDSLYAPAKLVYDLQNNLQTVKLCVLSNCLIGNYPIKNNRIGGKLVFADTWDLRKIYDNLHKGTDHVAIDVDFENDYKYKIPYIQMESDAFGYKCILAMLPAKLLYKLYEKHNTDLLLNNVRYFLGLKGSKKNNANIGINQTLKTESQMFLAYNNGLTAVAESIESFHQGEQTDVNGDADDSHDFISTGILKCIHDFRIVNGGQTTASIFYSKKNNRDEVSLRGVYVQMKLVILNENIDATTAKITQYSNSQSKIKYADFSVNNPFNIAIQNISRAVKVPNANNDVTYWFFERLRGQYEAERSRHSRKEEIKLFEAHYPKANRFKKEEVAKVWMAWNQSPHIAVKGDTGVYDAFMKEINDSGLIPDENYYRQTIALIILYRYLSLWCKMSGMGDGRAPVTLYTMAYLKYITFDQFDLEALWKRQKLTDHQRMCMNEVANKVFLALRDLNTNAALSMSNICKRAETYKELKNAKIEFEFNIPSIY